VTIDHGSALLPRWETSAATAPQLVAGLFLAAVAACLTLVAMGTSQVSGQIVWGAIALAVFCTGLLLLMASLADYQGLGLATWRFGPWCLVWGALAFGLATISWVGSQSGPPAEILPGSILRALWMIAAAMTLLTAGYCVGPYRIAVVGVRRATGHLNRRFTDEFRGPAIPWVLFTVGIIAQLASALLTGRFGYVGDVSSSVTTASGYGQYLAVAGECVPLAVAAAAVRAYQDRTLAARVTLTVLFTTAIVAGAVAGGKASFVVAILAVLVPRAAIRRRVPVAALLAAVLFFLLLIVPFNLAYRASARGAVTLSTGQAVASAPAIAGQVLASDISPAALRRSSSFLAQRLRAIDSPAIILQRTPSEIPYSNPGQLLISPVVDLIPRILWPGKPILAVGYQISQQYFQLPAQIYTSSDVTPEADLYRHGGWIPFIIGMFLGGCGLRILDDATDLRRSVHGAFLIILLFPDIVQAGSDCSTLLAGIPGIVLLWYVVIAGSFNRRSRASVSRPAQR
jgi:hypothetical protein